MPPLPVRLLTAVALLLLTLAAAQPAAAAADGSGLKKLTFLPLWRHQAQFAGYYVAREKGIYARHGIDLEILNGGPERSPEKSLKTGRADIAVLWLATAVKERASGGRIVNIAQIVQRSSMLLIAKKSSGITKVADMQHRRLGVWDDAPNVQTQAFLRRHRLKMKIIPQVHTANIFLRDGIDVASALWYNEYHTILNAGLNPDELTLFFLNDHGRRFPEDGLYMNEERYRKDPGLAAAFARASLEGWQYAFDHPDEALDIVLAYMKKANLPVSRAHQKWMLARMQELMRPVAAGGQAGQLEREDYASVAGALRSSGIITREPTYGEFTGRGDVRK